MEIISNQINSFRPQLSSNTDESVRKIEDIELTESRTDPTRREDSVNASDKSEPLVASEKDKSDGKSANANPDLETEGQDSDQDTDKESSNKLGSDQQLNDEERKQLEQLKKRDLEVRAHEAAHLAAAGQYATSGAKLDYKRGPDGGLYAVSGEVEIDTSKPSDPEEALRKAEQIRAAALAPAKPSAQDRAVAAQATQLAAEARAEILQSSGDDEGAEVVESAPLVADKATDSQSVETVTFDATKKSSEQNAENDDRTRAAAQQYQDFSRIPRATTGVELDVVA